MAGFRKDKTGVAQTAANSASTVVSALITAGIVKTEAAAKKAFDTHYTNVYAELAQVVDEDNELFAKLDAEERKSAPRSTSNGGGQNRGRSSGSGGGGTVSVDDALATVFNFGAFKDLTIGEVIDMDAEATADYGYDKGGKAYITWLAKSKDNAFMAKRAKVVLDNARSGSDS